MREQLLSLIEVQKIDLALQKLTEQAKVCALKLATQQEQQAQKNQKIQELGKQEEQAKAEALNLHQQLESEVHKVRKWENRLNEIRNQREYQALMRETEAQKRANKDLEEKINQTYQVIEKLQEESSLLQTELELLLLEHSTEAEQVQAEIAQLESVIASHQHERNQCIALLPSNLVREYDSVRQRRLGVGLAAVLAGYCTGCNIKLSPQLYNLLQRGDAIHRCSSCHRIIYWESPDAIHVESGSSDQVAN